MMLFIFGVVTGIVIGLFAVFIWDFSSGWIKPKKNKENTSKFPTSR